MSLSQDTSVEVAENGTVLVVDDDEHWAWATAQLLSRETGFTVETAHTLAAARDRFETLDTDCVVCDYELGDGDGLMLLDAVRRLDSDLPFLLVTGKGDESVASAAIRRGASDYITKGRDNEDELLVSRVRTLVRTHRSERALERQRQMKTAALDVLTETATESELCREFCRRLVESDAYALAWLGTTSGRTAPVPRASAGRDQYLDTIVNGTTLPAGEPARVASEQNETTISAVDADGTDVWETVAADHGFSRVIAVPIQYDGVTFGVLAVYLATGVANAVGTNVIEAYAESVGYALQSIDQKRSLLSSQPVRVELTVDDQRAPLIALADRLPPAARITSPSVFVRNDGTTVYLSHIEGVSSDQIESIGTELPDVAIRDVQQRGETVKCTVTTARTTPEELLVNNGARFEQTTVEAGAATVSAYIRADKHVGEVATLVENHFADTTVSTIWTDAQHATVTDNPFATLTAKQEEILRHAYHEGYFERPREANATEIADRLGITRQTFSQHLRAAERKVFRTWQSSDYPRRD